MPFPLRKTWNEKAATKTGRLLNGFVEAARFLGRRLSAPNAIAVAIVDREASQVCVCVAEFPACQSSSVTGITRMRGYVEFIY
jgi:hypothetical protein